MKIPSVLLRKIQNIFVCSPPNNIVACKLSTLSFMVYLIVIFIISIIVIGAFPAVVQHALIKKEIKLSEALKSSLKKFGKVGYINHYVRYLCISIPLLVSVPAVIFNLTILFIIF